MRVGLFGNLANNAYNLGRLLRRHLDARLILHPDETFALSHPLWEDCDLILDWDLLTSGKTTWQFWNEKARELCWAVPDWVQHIAHGTLSRKQVLREVTRSPALAIRAVLCAIPSVDAIKWTLKHLHIARVLSSFDFLAVYGEGPIYASLLGIPFVAIPWGGDLTIDAFRDDLLGRMQRSAYAKASRILAADPDFIQYLNRLNLSNRWTYFPFPVDTDRYAPARSLAHEDPVLEAIPKAFRDKFIFFMPSRHDFYWKGTDRALRAFLRLSHERADVALITPTWGADTCNAQQLVGENNGDDHVVFLPYVMSKRRLIRFYHAADVVLDQFVLGSYGTSTLEAMACEKAVITHIESKKYVPHFTHLPPNLQASSEQEILEKMKWAVENRGALPAIGRESRRWVIDEHSARPIKILEEAIRDAV